MAEPNSLQIEQHNILQFQGDFLHAYQNWGAKLLPHVMEEDASGEAVVISHIYDKATATESDARFRANPQSVTQRKRRWISICPMIEWGEMIETEDEMRQMRNPQSDLLKNGAAAVGRAIDARIVAGMIAPVMEGKLLSGATAVPFPAADIIAATVGTTDGTTQVGLNPEKLRMAIDRMGENEIDLDRVEPKLLLSTRDHTELSRYVELTSADFYRTEGEKPYYVDGKLRRVMGFELIRFNALPTSGGLRTAIAFIKDDLVAKKWQGLAPDAWMLTANRKIPYVYAKANYNCGRKRDGGVIQIKCKV